MENTAARSLDHSTAAVSPVGAVENRFRVEVDNLGPDDWHAVVALFSDASIHQTWSFGALRWGNGKLHHLVLYENDSVVAAAQLAVVSVPLLRTGIAHCKFGPMWRSWNMPERPEIYHETLKAMRAEFADKRGLVLRVKPWTTDITNDSHDAARREAGLEIQPQLAQYHTFVIDMSRSVDELRAGFSQKWRYNLRKAEKHSLEITHGHDSAAAEVFMQLYAEMRDLKTFVDTSEIELLPDLTRNLPEAMRPTVFIAYCDGQAAAAIVISLIGTTAFYLFGATGSAGRNNGASYVLFWHAMNWLNGLDCRWFDLVGSRPQGTGGGAGYRRFKSGMTGKNGDEYHMSDWEISGSRRGHIVVHGGTFLRDKIRSLRHGLNSVKERLFRARI